MLVSLRAASAAVDISIASIMIYCLYREGIPQFLRFVFRLCDLRAALTYRWGKTCRTRQTFVRLMILLANTGTWTAGLAILVLALVSVTTFTFIVGFS